MCKSETYVLDASFNPEEFVEDIKKAKAAVGEATHEDAQHLQRLVFISQVLLYGGHVLLLTGAALPFGAGALLSLSAGALMIAYARCMKWAIIGHHVSHGGYDSLQKKHPDALPKHYKRGVFAIGFRRFFDWLDWMLPQAWDVEHNKAHHYYLSEEKDPDLVEHNFELLRAMALPKALKYASMALWVFTWKFTYYSPNTYKELALSKKDSWLARSWPSWSKQTDPVVVFDALRMPLEALWKGKPKDSLFWAAFFAEWSLAVLPMLISVALPAVWPLLLGHFGLWLGASTASEAAVRALVTAVVADMFSNAHAFVIIACNHSGGDLYRYSTSCKAYSAEFLLRCAYSSANFECGNDLVDITYGWLNYQIEHHMFPDMTPLQYRKFQPLVKSICKKHGVMYVQQNALKRTWMMFQVMGVSGPVPKRPEDAALPQRPERPPPPPKKAIFAGDVPPKHPPAQKAQEMPLNAKPPPPPPKKAAGPPKAAAATRFMPTTLRTKKPSQVAGGVLQASSASLSQENRKKLLLREAPKVAEKMDIEGAFQDFMHQLDD